MCLESQENSNVFISAAECDGSCQLVAESEQILTLWEVKKKWCKKKERKKPKEKNRIVNLSISFSQCFFESLVFKGEVEELEEERNDERK